MREYYKILNVSENASDEQIEQAYLQLKAQYSKERFSEGEVGNLAAKNLTRLETAYSEIMAYRNAEKEKEATSSSLIKVENLLKQGDLTGAQQALDDIGDRGAEWHYLQSVVFYKKNWINESKKQLEIALSIEPHNQKYSDAYGKLKQKIEFNERQFYSGNANQGYSNTQYQSNRQMGGTNDCMTFCATWCCMDMLCSMCCR